MYFKYILFGILFFSQNLYAELDEEIINKFTFPKYDTIAHSPIEISYKEKKGTVLFINEKGSSDKKGDLKVYFLTKDNQELNQAFEISSEDYTELVSAFVFKEKKKVINPFLF